MELPPAGGNAMFDAVNCPSCGSDDFQIIDSLSELLDLTRTRHKCQCENCGRRFSIYTKTVTLWVADDGEEEEI